MLRVFPDLRTNDLMFLPEDTLYLNFEVGREINFCRKFDWNLGPFGSQSSVLTTSTNNPKI